MLETSDELIAGLDQVAAGERVDVTDVMTRMTFETISYTGFDTKFGALTSQETPPFVQAMFDVLTDAMGSASRILPRAFHPIARGRRDRADAELAPVSWTVAM
ncbi:MAG: hypothetical protein IPG04_28675 [Polyangiaceae bacterium]|jgi:cytochrome P450|nr:hypothetical protein [Polyangiaceae bacterium]